MDFCDVLRNRRSVRKYTDEHVNLDTIKKCILLWMHAPSAHNEQPWEFYVTENKKILLHLSEKLKYWKMLSSASCIICVAYKPGTMRSLMYIQQDLSACIENILLSLYNEWLWWVRLWTYPDEENCNIVKQYLKLWKDVQPFALISIWKPDPEEKYFDKECEFEDRIQII